MTHKESSFSFKICINQETTLQRAVYERISNTPLLNFHLEPSEIDELFSGTQLSRNDDRNDNNTTEKIILSSF